MKKGIIFLIQLLLMVQLHSQDTTIVFVDNKKVCTTISAEDKKGTDLLLKKSLYQNYTKLVLQVNSEHMHNSSYKKDLEITADNTVMAAPIQNKPGFFDISGIIIQKQLTAGKPLHIYLLLNPADPMMMIPSRRIYLGDLVMK